jgi:chromosome segregation ATPase
MNDDEFHQQLKQSVLANNSNRKAFSSGGTSQLLEKSNDVHHARDALATEHESFTRQDVILDERAQRLAEKGNELERGREVFDRYIATNEAKRQDAQKRAASAEQECAKIKEEIAELNEQIGDLQRLQLEKEKRLVQCGLVRSSLSKMSIC